MVVIDAKGINWQFSASKEKHRMPPEVIGLLIPRGKHRRRVQGCPAGKSRAPLRREIARCRAKAQRPDLQTRVSGDPRARTRGDCESAGPWPKHQWSWSLQTREFVQDEREQESREPSACCRAVRFRDDAHFRWKRGAGVLPNELQQQRSRKLRRCRQRSPVGPVLRKAFPPTRSRFEVFRGHLRNE